MLSFPFEKFILQFSGNQDIKSLGRTISRENLSRQRYPVKKGIDRNYLDIIKQKRKGLKTQYPNLFLHICVPQDI